MIMRSIQPWYNPGMKQKDPSGDMWATCRSKIVNRMISAKRKNTSLYPSVEHTLIPLIVSSLINHANAFRGILSGNSG